MHCTFIVVKAYWIEGGEEICSGCDAVYAYAVEARCVGCDRAYCQLCFVTVAGEIFCTDCNEEQGEPKRWRRALSGKR